MTFSNEQIASLNAPLSREHVKTRGEGKKTLSYIEGWHAIAEANRVFGFDRWARETINFECVVERERKIGVTKDFAGYDGWSVTYTCKVRVTVDGVTREGCGAGHGIGVDLGLAHESAIKEAETDAMKRALMTFGNPFGLALYDKQQANVADAEPDEPPPPPPRRSTPPSEGPPPTPEQTQTYIKGCEETIEDLGGDVSKLMHWWNSDAQRAARRKYLSEGQMEVLKAKVISKIPKEANGRS